MISRVRQGCFAVMLIASSCLVSVPACAQSLALSYILDVNSAQLQRVSISNEGCAAVRWAATVTTCARADALGRFSWSAAAEEEATQSQSAVAGEDGGKAGPAGGGMLSSESNEQIAGRAVTISPAAPAPTDAQLRPPAVRDSAAATLKPDPTFRLASKQRLRSGDDDVKYTDVALQNRNPKNNFNALGVELLIPFH